MYRIMNMLCYKLIVLMVMMMMIMLVMLVTVLPQCYGDGGGYGVTYNEISEAAVKIIKWCRC